MAKTPPTWLNKEFFEKALRSNGKDPNLTVTSYEIKRAAAVGDHYGSEMYRATLKTNGNGTTGETSLIIKCKLRAGELITKMIEDSDIFIKEARTFTDIHIPMVNMLKNAFPDDFQPIAAKCIYTNFGLEAIVLEDLKKKGFRLATVTHGLDLKHCLLVMRKIAQYHASSLVLRRQHPSLFESFMDSFFGKNKHNGMSGLFSSIIKSVSEEAKKWPGYEHYIDTLSSLEKSMMDHWVDGVARDEIGFNVLIHGDLWMNNMMFRYSEGDEEVQEVRFVDFQLSYVTSPAVDLQYFMNSSASPEVLENHRQELIDKYYSALCETLSVLGHEDLQPTKDTLNSELEKKALFGALAALSVRTFALADRNHVPDLDNLLTNNETVYLSDSYKEAIKKLLPLYEKWGWLKI